MKRTVSTILLAILLTSMLYSAFKIMPAEAAGTIYIRADGSIDPPSANITSLDNVTYTFATGIYESVVVQRNNIIIDGNDYGIQESGSSGIGVHLVGVSNVTVENMSIFSSEDGVYAFACSEITIADTWIFSTYGIYLQSSSGSTISNNRFWSCSYGIVLSYSSNNTLLSNYGGGRMQGGGGSIHLVASTNNMLSGNSIPVGSIVLDGSPNNTLYSNHVSEGDIADFVLNNSNWNNLTGNFAGGPGCSIALSYSAYNTLSKNVLGTGMGICVSLYSSSFNALLNNVASGYYTAYGFNGFNLDSSSNNVLLGNNVTDYWDGIYLISSPDNTMFGNTLSKNSNAGIEIAYSSSITVSENNITNNGCGIVLNLSHNVTIYHNNFVNNTIQAYANQSSSNLWDNGYPSGGNYWSDYGGVDVFCGVYQNETGSDGLGDSPYQISSTDQDHYPLAKPYVGPADIELSYFSKSKTVVGKGCLLNVTLGLLNSGLYTEAFDLLICANETVLETVNCLLTSREFVSIKLTLFTTDWPTGNCTLWAYVQPLPTETDISDNNLAAGYVRIASFGDIAPEYGVVDIFDIVTVAIAFSSTPADYNWNANADINNDGIIDIFDIVVVATHFGETG